METAVEKLQFLERILTGNILSFAKGVTLNIDKSLNISIIRIIRGKQVSFKGVKLIALNVEFRSNFFLPNHIGLGKGVSLGFGTVREKRRLNSESNNPL
jgi:hypothetical protein